MLKGFTRHHGAAWRRKTAALVAWIIASSIMFVACSRLLLMAYTTHTVITPLRRYRRIVSLEDSPDIFWIAVTVYAFVVVCSPVGLASWIGDLVAQFRPLERHARKSGVDPG